MDAPPNPFYFQLGPHSLSLMSLIGLGFEMTELGLSGTPEPYL